MLWNHLCKTKRQTIKIHRNGYTFQIDPENPSVRYFGGGGSTVKRVDPWKGTGMRELFGQYTDYISPYVGAVSGTVPGASSLQQAGFNVAQGLTPIATGGQQYFGDISGQVDTGVPSRATQTAEQALAGVLAPYDPEMAMQAVEPARKLALDTFFRDIIPQLKESYVSKAGTADTGALNRAMAREASNLSQGLSAQLAPYLYAGSEAQKNRQVTGVNQAMNLAQMPGQIMGQAGNIAGLSTDILSQILNMGSMQRGINQEQWQYQQPWANPYTQVLSSLMSSAPQYGYVEQQQSPGLASMLMPALGMGLGGYFGSTSGSNLLTSGLKSLFS